MKLTDYPIAVVDGAPGFGTFQGWKIWEGETPYGASKAVVCAEWDGKIETYVFDSKYVAEL